MTASPSQPPAGEGLALGAYAGAVWKRRVLVAAICGAAVAGTLAYCLLSPKYYESRATLIIPKESASSGLGRLFMASMVGNALPGGINVSALTPNRDLFMSILRSDTMARAVIDEFGLRERYGAELTIDAMDTLRRRALVSVTAEGLIAITVEETSPQLAADVANFFVHKLDAMLTGFESSEASKQRVFVEGRLTKTLADLRLAEEALRAFQEEHKAFALQDQARGLVEEVARLKGQIIAEEVLLEGLRATAAPENPEVTTARRRIDAMKLHLEKQFGEALDLTPGDEERAADGAREVRILPFKDFPELGLELARLMRELKVQETVFTLLTQQLEEAKIAEARDMPKVQPIDRAVPAERKSRPLTRVSVLLAGATSLFASIVLALVLEAIEGRRRRTGAATPAAAPDEEVLPTAADGEANDIAGGRRGRRSHRKHEITTN